MGGGFGRNCGGSISQCVGLCYAPLAPHNGLDEAEHHHNASLNRILLFVMTIALHKLPEGMAAGVSVSDEGNYSWAVSMGIALQNIPEGMVVIAPLLLAGVRP